MQASLNNRVIPSATYVYEKTHGFEMPDGENILISDRANKVVVSGD